MQQGSAEWKQARLGKCTSSRFDDVMKRGRAGGPSKTAETYMLEIIGEILTGKSADDIQAKQLVWGHTHEPNARAWYIFEKGLELRETGFEQHPKYDRVGGSPDALVGDEGILEIKCPWTTKTHLNTILTQCVPSEYEAQVQGNLWVTGRQWCDFVSYDPRMLNDNLASCVIRVERDEDYIDELEDQVCRFLDQMQRKLDKIISWGGQ